MSGTLGESSCISVDQAAVVLGISRSLAFEGVRNGTIPALRIGRRWLVPRVQLEKFLAGE